VDVYSGRGVLIESQGPTWVYGVSSEHSTLYQFQISRAQNIYLGHIQTETPYFQTIIPATRPYDIGGRFYHDPTFTNCPLASIKNPHSLDNDTCYMAWALRVIDSKDVWLYGGGFYSFFKHYKTTCAETFDCQDHIIDTSYSESLWFYDVWTVGAVESFSPQG
jgi:hypothetical protein